MSSLPSSLNLGSSVNTAVSFCNFDSGVCLIRRVPFRRKGGSFATSNYIAEQGSSISTDSTYRGSKDNGAGSFLTGAPKPVLKSGCNVDPLLSMAWDENRRGGDSDGETIIDKEKERSRAIESLGEVLEKVEKLETGKKVILCGEKPPADERAEQKKVMPIKSGSRKSKTMKSVWRKGDLVASVEKVRQVPRVDGGGSTGSRTVARVRPSQPPQKVEPNLETRPSVSAPPVRRPVILKKSPVSSRSDFIPESKQRKPLLIDKYAAKKPVVDPLIAQAVLAPPKPGRNPAPSKFKDDYRKKGGPRRSMGFGKDDIRDEDTSELNVSIPGAAAARKGRKWSKASRRAARLQAARDAAPIRVEIMEVGEDGMLIEELAENLAISEGEILGYFYAKGIKPDGVQKLSKDMVKMICNEYKVEVINAVPVRMEEMAKKKEILDEDDLDKLENRPPVVTIMGHVDHGKVK